ncbi:homoserine dehydrogenase [Ensifer sp. ENS04]|uniref:homoserine dehydrogenase n=1 Tax=Ensifer sp. ENS04 TaxID=2769281 RepID=UPI0017815DBA|nr:homoserine dehydrogenase [Ensifer sp. ENS04]MBD9544760.1 homoserine dehydrogenase [Ensifer sp. ENS04]
MRQVKVAIAGFGGVGRAVASLLLTRRERYRAVYNTDVRLVAVCGSRAGTADPSGLEQTDLSQFTDGHSGSAFILSAKPDVLIEAGPSNFRTGAPGLDYIGAALDAGVHAVVISKGALVFDGNRLRERARKSGAILKVSGATAAALPTIDLFDYNLKGCRFLHVEGILNATTNYLLTAMMEGGLRFFEALRRAQEEGIAETDPRNDVEGWDTACKLLILANFGLGADLTMDDLSVEGIQNVSDAQIRQWREAGVIPKLVGEITLSAGSIGAAVRVKTFAPSEVFAQVRGKDKAIRVATDSMGDIVAIGCASEPKATASAALKDFEHILSIASGN